MRREHAAQVRVAAADAAQFLLDFGAMAVAGDAVGLEVVGRFGEQQADFALASGPRHARRAAGDQVCGVDRAGGAQQRRETDLHRRRVAAGVGDDARVADRVAVQFGQAVGGFAQQVGAGVRHAVPALESRGVAQPEVSGEVDDAHAGVEQRARLLHRDAVRRREEDHVAVVQRRVVGGREAQVGVAAQAGEHLGHRGACFLARGDRAQPRVRMVREQTQQFDPGVSGSADDSDVQYALHDAAVAPSQNSMPRTGHRSASRVCGPLQPASRRVSLSSRNSWLRLATTRCDARA
ncbi:hypothetical protein GALL_344110 [mine drainage metagenome]|uniref:Uncharacterized protein n=1 Tax=mine drainage metagenome TaxID=410659 RepID=A0A1J5QJT7_9ZZZZ